MSRIGSAVVIGAISGLVLFACGDKKNPLGDVPSTGVDGGTGGASDGGATGAGDAGTPTVSYSKTIAPMMAASCTISGCHGGASPALGIGLDTYANVKTNASRANSSIQSGAMPIGTNAVALTAADKQNFQDWVNAGMPNN